MDAHERAAFLAGIGSIAANNLRQPETRQTFMAVAEVLADNFDSPARACAALQLVITYGQGIAAEAYTIARAAIADRQAA